jgi:hypothetical protein
MVKINFSFLPAACGLNRVYKVGIVPKNIPLQSLE